MRPICRAPAEGLFVHIEPQNGGWGATNKRDGASGMIAVTDGDTYNYSVELLEAKFPLFIRRYTYNVEGGVGAGSHRGGFGLVREYVIESDNVVLHASYGRTATPPWGVDGGLEGSLNGIEVVRGGARRRLTRPPQFPLDAGIAFLSLPAEAEAGANHMRAPPTPWRGMFSMISLRSPTPQCSMGS